MMNDLITNPSAFEGYGEGQADEIRSLIKALQAQEGVTDVADLQGGGALQPQSLETQLAMLTFQEKHLKLFKKIGIQKAFSTLEEYSVQDGYGTEGGFVGQLENPEEDDADFRREFAVVKYIRTLWRVADVLQYSRTITDAEVKQVQAAMMRALRTTEKTLFFGDSAMIPQSFDGLQKTIVSRGTADQVIDLRGANITELDMKLGAEIITANYGTPTEMYNSLSVQTTIDNILGTSTQRLNQDALKGDGSLALGHSINEMRTSFGNFGFEPDIFINPESQGVPVIKNPADPTARIEGPTSAKAPATPSFTLTASGAPATGSLWAASGSGGAIAGAYNYRVVAINQYGKSQAAALKTETSVVGQKITIAITPGAGAYAATAYEIYRETAPGAGDMFYLTTVAATGSPTNHDDLNEDLSGTSTSFLVDNTTVGELRTMSLSQLAPMHKVEYAKIGPYRWGTVNFYAVPKWYAPTRFIMFKNIGVSQRVRNPLVDL